MQQALPNGRASDTESLMKNLLTAILMTIVTTILLGVIYPLAITGLAQAIFPDQANGSRIVQNGKLVGSDLLDDINGSCTAGHVHELIGGIVKQIVRVSRNGNATSQMARKVVH